MTKKLAKTLQRNVGYRVLRIFRGLTLSLQARLGPAWPQRIRDWGPLGCFLENKEEIWAFVVPLYNHSWRWFKLIAPTNTHRHTHTLVHWLLTNSMREVKAQSNLLTANLFVSWTNFKDGWDYAARLGWTVGLPSDRLTGSIFTTTHTEVKEKQLMWAKACETQNTILHVLCHSSFFNVNERTADIRLAVILKRHLIGSEPKILETKKGIIDYRSMSVHI